MTGGIAGLSLATAMVLLAIAALHAYWLVGGRWAAQSAVPETGGKPLFTPGPASTLGVTVLLVFAAQIVAQRGGSGPALIPAWMANAGTWTIAVVFLLRAVGDFRYVGFFKRVRDSRFAQLDTMYFSPLVLGLGLCALIIANS